MFRIVHIFLLISFLILGACSKKYSDHPMIDLQTLSDTDPRQTILYLDKQIKQSPDLAILYYKKAALLFELEEYKNASILIEKAINFDPKKADYYVLQARLFAIDDEVEKASEASIKAQRYGANVLLIADILADLYLHLGKNEQALSYAKQLVSIFPEVPGYHYRLASIYLKTQDTLQAIAVLNQTLQLDSTYSEAHFDLYHIALQREEYQQAHQYFSIYKQSQELSSALVWQEIELLNNLKETDQVQYLLRQLAEVGEQQALLQLRNTYLNTNKLDSALYFNQAYLQATDSLPEALLVQARIWDRKYDYAKARNLYQIIIERDSSMNLAREELASLNRKIAYLRKVQEERSQPLPMLQPIKLERKESDN